MFHEALLEFVQNTAFYAYLIVFAIGLAWIVIGLVLGGLESMAEFAHDVAAEVSHDGDSWGQQQLGLSPLSPIMLAILGMLFGITGMTLTVFSPLGTGAVLLTTIVVAAVLDGLVYWGMFNFFVKSQSSSLASVGEAVGRHATVATRIAPGMTGTVNLELAGRRTVASAKAADEGTHEPGEVVRVVSMEGGIARVRKDK
jgi:membrane protein implicated in regulation of membrane protease activity